MRVRARVAAGIFAALAIFSAPGLAFAGDIANCSEYGYVNRQIGYATGSWSNHRFGNRAILENLALHLCSAPRPGEGSGSFALVNIEGPSTIRPYNTVQVGIGQCIGSGQGCLLGMHDLWSYGLDSSAPGCAGWQTVVPTPHFEFSYSGGWTYVVKQTAVHTFDLYACSGAFEVVLDECWTNQYATTFNESWDYGDALGGSSSNLFDYTVMQFQTSLNGAWIPLSSSCNVRLKENGTLESVFYCGPAGQSAISTWTNR